MKPSSKSTNRGLETFPYDVADSLRIPEDRVEYLDVWFEDFPEDAKGISKAVWDVARAQGIDQVAGKAGLSYQSIQLALTDNADPSFATVMKVLTAMGIRLRALMASPQDTGFSTA